MAQIVPETGGKLLWKNRFQRKAAKAQRLKGSALMDWMWQPDG
jgi:hypothetical protein